MAKKKQPAVEERECYAQGLGGTIVYPVVLQFHVEDLLSAMVRAEAARALVADSPDAAATLSAFATQHDVAKVMAPVVAKITEAVRRVVRDNILLLPLVERGSLPKRYTGRAVRSVESYHDAIGKMTDKRAQRALAKLVVNDLIPKGRPGRRRSAASVAPPTTVLAEKAAFAKELARITRRARREDDWGAALGGIDGLLGAFNLSPERAVTVWRNLRSGMKPHRAAEIEIGHARGHNPSTLRRTK